jgi:hypothetical protein
MASVQSSLVMHPIDEFGSEAQKAKYLPGLGKQIVFLDISGKNLMKIFKFKPREN